NVVFDEQVFPFKTASNNTDIGFNFDGNEALLPSTLPLVLGTTHSQQEQRFESPLAKNLNLRTEQITPQITSFLLSFQSCGRLNYYGNPVAHMSQSDPDSPNALITRPSNPDEPTY
ncbi:hypothetical protein MJO29_013692, partial [Puccinia striiformis f. sp. tritici]